MNRLYRLSAKVVEFYSDKDRAARQIMHTQSVAHFTRLISEGEGLSEHDCQMQESAAWLHDIGCPPSMVKYGDSLPPHQEAEGKLLVHEWLDGSEDYSQDEVDWLADGVGGHHRLTEARRLKFEPLYEADLIVNLFESYYKDPQNFVDSGAVSTPTGLALFRTLFGTHD